MCMHVYNTNSLGRVLQVWKTDSPFILAVLNLSQSTFTLYFYSNIFCCLFVCTHRKKYIILWWIVCDEHFLIFTFLFWNILCSTKSYSCVTEQYQKKSATAWKFHFYQISKNTSLLRGKKFHSQVTVIRIEITMNCDN